MCCETRGYSAPAMAPPIDTRLLALDDRSLALARALILAGEVVAVGTETVYGLAADATNADAVARIYEAKGRPSFNPLIVHVESLADAERLGRFSDEARRLAEAHWPGPLTLVVPQREENGIAALATAGLSTLAIRVPSDPAIRRLLKATGRPLAAPSANASGTISPTRADHVLKSLDTRIALILNSGPCDGGIESTIIASTGGPLRLLRKGPVMIEEAVDMESTSVEAPGQLASHYAPGKPLRLDARQAGPSETLIGYGDVGGDLHLGHDLKTAAARLFDLLHQADRTDSAAIAVAPIPDEGLGAAINDRLRRAAAPR